MAVAVKNAPATTPVTPPRRLANLRGLDTIVGVVCTIAAIWLVFYGIPLFWANVLHFTDSFLGIALLMLAMILVAGGLGFVGVRRMGAKPRPGLRAGIVVGVVLVCIAGLITSSIGHSVEATFGTNTGSGGLGITVAVLVLLLACVAWALTRPTFDRWMVNVDAQGWFTFAPYKRTQGQKVRRGTILGILILWACGIYSLVAHWAPTPVGQPMPAWDVYIPFSGGQSIQLLPALHITVPVLLAIAAFWFAYRVVSL
ncbi:MAG TPA: hypothetical protein VFA18_16185, partial [Gemmataceae bacterium]|nr:hypothetical protein [Gemmataceae bacterium]